MLLLSASAQRGLRPAAALFQCWAGTSLATRRLLGSTPSDELNREMAEFFGVHGAQEQTVGPSAIAGAPAAGAAAAAAAAEMMPPGGLQGDVYEFNAELLGVLGAPPGPRQQQQQPQAAADRGPSQAQQLAVAAAAATARRHASGGSSSASSFSAGGSPAGGSSADGGGEQGARLTHVDASGRATMVDVSHKRGTVRSATAAARVLLGADVYRLLAANQIGKGDVLTVAQLAGVMGAKHTAALIPLCHNIALSSVRVSLALAPAAAAVDVTAEATAVGPTGVEMEALTAAAVAALTVYDMCKAASKGIEVTGLRLLRKSGGKSGDWERGGGGDAVAAS